MIDLNCPFEALCVVGVPLANAREEVDYADWFVVFSTCGDDGLYYQTNVYAMVDALNKTYGHHTAKLLSGFRGERIAVVDPSSSSALALAAAYVAEMEAGNHIDLHYYRQELDLACALRWLEMSRSDRIEMLQSHKCSVALMLSDTVPSDLRPTLAEMFE
jgi:hypothetical protein